MAFLGYPFRCQELVADNNSFLHVLSKLGTSRICINLDLDPRLIFCITISSKGWPELLILPFVKVVENITRCYISQTDLGDLCCSIASESRVEKFRDPVKC
jgi:hypothetical protein